MDTLSEPATEGLSALWRALTSQAPAVGTTPTPSPSHRVGRAQRRIATAGPTLRTQGQVQVDDGEFPSLESSVVTAKAGTGAWGAAPESMSARAAAYQASWLRCSGDRGRNGKIGAVRFKRLNLGLLVHR